MQKPSNLLLVLGAAIGVIAWLIVGFSTDRVAASHAAQLYGKHVTQKASWEALAPACLSKFEQAPYQPETIEKQKAKNTWARNDTIQSRALKGRTQRIRLLCAIFLSAL